MKSSIIIVLQLWLKKQKNGLKKLKNKNTFSHQLHFLTHSS